MKGSFTISLKNRLALTYALFISLALGALTLLINIFTGIIFTALVKDNIAEKSEEIARAIGEQYDPLNQGFNTSTVEAMGMFFLHEGYIVTVEDEKGNFVWAARSCDMRQCMDVVDSISLRMEQRFRLKGSMRIQVFPVKRGSLDAGTITIETYGPFFFSETETRFLASINRLLLGAAAVITLFGVCLSIPLARAIAKPVLKAGEAARMIAKVHSGGVGGEDIIIRIPEGYRTRELAELSRSINKLAGELEESKRRQKQLSADIAHELRSPLTCLQGNMEALIDGVFKPDREHLESCHEEILRLAKLVRDLNTLTNLEWENITLEKTKFDLAKLLQVTAEQFRPAILEKGLKLELDLRESPVNADYGRMKQVFINILSNAINYTDRGAITVSVRDGGFAPRNLSAAAPPPRLIWEAVVADTGIGIPEGDLSRVFERFYRSDKSRGRGSGGAGIGLAIAAAIVHAHGGTISAESGGGGSTFRVRL